MVTSSYEEQGPIPKGWLKAPLPTLINLLHDSGFISTQILVIFIKPNPRTFQCLTRVRVSFWREGNYSFGDMTEV